MSKPPKVPRDKGWDILSSMTKPDQSELRKQLRTYNWSSDKDYQVACIAFKELITANTNAEIAKVLDRIDGDKDYSPENCRWADAVTQSRNRRNVYEAKGGNRVDA